MERLKLDIQTRDIFKDKLSESEIKKVKTLCDRFYKNPPIAYDDIVNAKLNSVYLINIDKNFAKEIDPVKYHELTMSILGKSEIDL